MNGPDIVVGPVKLRDMKDFDRKVLFVIFDEVIWRWSWIKLGNSDWVGGEGWEVRGE